MRANVTKVTDPKGVKLTIPYKKEEPLEITVEPGEYIVEFLGKGSGIKLPGHPKFKTISVSLEHLARNYKPAEGQKMGEDGEYHKIKHSVKR